MPRSEHALPFDVAYLHELWGQAKAQLRAQLEQRAPEAVFLEGSIAEGFGNPRSDVDFVAIVDDGTKVATMPYILFLGERRVEVRLLSRERLVRELGELGDELARGLPEPSTRIGWNKLERCQRFMHCLPIQHAAYIETLQEELGLPALERIVSEWFRDFAREAARHAVAMYSLDQLDAAACWLKTSVFHAAKSYVARRGEHYLGSKWLAMQMERCEMDGALQRRLRELLFDARGELSAAVHLERGIRLLADLEVDGVSVAAERVRTGKKPGVTTWQIGRHLHVVRGADVFRLGRPAALAWRNVTFGAPCLAGLDAQHAKDAARRHKAYLADFARKGLLALCWDEQEIRARHGDESRPVSFGSGPIISVDGARLVEDSESDVQLLPLPALRFAEAGVNLTWAHIGVENAREDSLGALRKQQWSTRCSASCRPPASWRSRRMPSRRSRRSRRPRWSRPACCR
jgi:predicted nucleotidyltransferase